jgi:hypothetical protein
LSAVRLDRGGLHLLAGQGAKPSHIGSNLVCDWVGGLFPRWHLGAAKPVGWLANKPQQATSRDDATGEAKALTTRPAAERQRR